MILAILATVLKRQGCVNVKQISNHLGVTAVILGIIRTQSASSVNVLLMAPEGLNVLLLVVSAPASRLMEANFVENAHKSTSDILIVKVCIFSMKPLVKMFELFFDNGKQLSFTACACNLIGSQSPVCHNETGKCPCRSNFGGRQCDQCADGYHNYPECICGCLLYLIPMFLKSSRV